MVMLLTYEVCFCRDDQVTRLSRRSSSKTGFLSPREASLRLQRRKVLYRHSPSIPPPGPHTPHSPLHRREQAPRLHLARHSHILRSRRQSPLLQFSTSFQSYRSRQDTKTPQYAQTTVVELHHLRSTSSTYFKTEH